MDYPWSQGAQVTEVPLYILYWMIILMITSLILPHIALEGLYRRQSY